jgi:Virulence-associated protein E
MKTNGAARGFEGEHPRYGFPEKLYCYRDTAGEELFFVASYAQGHRVPWTHDGHRWQAKSAAKPFPLYGLHKLAASEAPVLILPDEATCEAFAAISSKAVAICCFGGLKGVEHAQIKPLAGRRVRLWLEAGQAGRSAIVALVARLTGVAQDLFVVDTEGEAEGFSARTLIENGVPASAVAAYVRERLVPAESYSGTTWAGEAVGPARLTWQPTEAPAPSTPKPPQEGSREVVASAAGLPVAALPEFADAHAAWRYFALEPGASGRPWASVENLKRVLDRHPQTASRFAFDLFRDNVLCDGKVWNAELENPGLTLLLQSGCHLHNCKSSLVQEAVEAVAKCHRRHPVREYLDALPIWDQVPRAPLLFWRGFGAVDSAYVQAVSVSFLVGAIARIYDPGCILRTLPVLEGKQKIGKSTGLSVLGGEWYLECTEKLDTKDFYQVVQGYWIIELSEIAGLMRADIEAVKACISKRDDVYRASYARRAASHPRQCVMAGSTNSSTWMTDSSGGTRFLPIACESGDIPWLKINRESLWAEALWRYQRGERYDSVPTEAATEEQEKRYVESPWEHRIRAHIARDPIVGKSVGIISTDMLKDLLGESYEKRSSRELWHDARELAKILTERIGWTRYNEKIFGVSAGVYRPPHSTERK